MNYLAHLYLSCDNEDLLIGNFIADFIRNKEIEKYSLEVQQGVKLHRQIDSYTDTHPLVKQATKRLHPHHHKYSPVVVDILYDYILANNWKRYSGQELEDFAKSIYGILENRFEELPDKLKRNLPGMIEANWLVAYKRESGLRFTFKKMDERTTFPSRFVDAVEHLQADYELYETEFNSFFPEVITYVETQCKC